MAATAVTRYQPAHVMPGMLHDHRWNVPVLPEPQIFRCPHCGARTRFTLYFGESEVLEPMMKAAMDRMSGPPGEAFSGPLHHDFHCSECARAVRLVYSALEFAMSSYVYPPLSVFVATQDPR